MLRQHHDLKGGDQIAPTDRTLRRLARTGAVTIKNGVPVEVFDSRPAAGSGATVVRLIVDGEARSFTFTGDVVCAG
jgi:hypothetical protein